MHLVVGSVCYYGVVGLEIIIILGLTLPPAGGAQGDCIYGLCHEPAQAGRYCQRA